MSENKLQLKRLEKTSQIARAAMGLDTHDRLMASMNTVRLPQNTISEALRSVLISQSKLTEISKMAQNLPKGQLQKAIDAAMGPSKAIQAAFNSMPHTNIQKAMSNLSQASVPKAHSLLSARQLPETPVSLEKRSDTKMLRDVADLGAAIRNARKQKGLTQQNFADLAGVGRRFLSELEQGKQTLEFGKVLKVAAAAGINLMYSPSKANQ